MKKINNNSIKNQNEKEEIWTGRYVVEAEVETLPHGRGYLENVWTRLFQPNMRKKELRALLKPFGFTPKMKEYAYIRTYAEETFSETQADKLIAYLETHRGTKASKKPAEKPTKDAMGIVCVPTGRTSGIYPLSEEPRYNLNFKASMYYKVFRN